MQSPPHTKPQPARLGAPKRSRSSRFVKSLIAAIFAMVLLVLLVDQVGLRRLSGSNFAVTDPMGIALKKQVEHLASALWGGREPGTIGNVAAAEYLAGELKTAGWVALPSVGKYLVPLPAVPNTPALGHNVIGYRPGTKFKTGIVLGAHFDHIGETKSGTLLGADDNASAVAVVLATLSLLRDHSFQHPFFVIFYNTEEAPYFGTPRQGSRAFVDALPPEIGNLSSIHLSVVLDLIGGVVWRKTADTIFACGAEKSSGLSSLVDGIREPDLDVRRFGIHLIEDLPGRTPQPVSDYDVFREHQVPFLFLSSGRTPRYHTAKDLPATLYYDRMARTARWLAKLLVAVDQVEKPFSFDPQGLDLATDAANVTWALQSASSVVQSIPGTSPMTLWRLRQDYTRLQPLILPGHTFTADDKIALDRASFRMQCLFYSYPICFTI